MARAEDPQSAPSSPAWSLLLNRVAADERFIGWLLAWTRETEEGLTRRLGCDVGGLVRLALCQRPDPESFAEDVRNIAIYAGCDPLRLRNLLREFSAVEGLQDANESPRNHPVSLLLAARDRSGEKPVGPHEPD